MDALINLKECKEYMTIVLNGQEHKIKLAGTIDTPYFCGKDVCEVLGYKDSKNALIRHVDLEEKDSLQGVQKLVAAAATNLKIGEKLEEKDSLQEVQKVVAAAATTFCIGKKYDNLSYNDSKAVYISEGGLYSLIMSSEAPFAKQFRRLVCNVILPSIRRHGTYTIEEQLTKTMEQLAIKDRSEEDLKERVKQERERAEQERERADEAHMKLRSETKRLKDQIKRTLEFNQATRQVEPREYIYICTTEHQQTQHKFKVGGVQTFELLKSRLCQYNSGKANSESHFFIFIRKTIDYRSIEHAIKGVLSGFRENQSSELYIIHYDWLVKFVNAIMDGNAEFAVLVNSNREQVADDTINKEPTIVPPIQLEKYTYQRFGEKPRELNLEPELMDAIQRAIESFEPADNMVRRKELEDHLLRTSPSVKLAGRKRDAWDMARTLGTTKNPMWRYKY